MVYAVLVVYAVVYAVDRGVVRDSRGRSGRGRACESVRGGADASEMVNGRIRVVVV